MYKPITMMLSIALMMLLTTNSLASPQRSEEIEPPKTTPELLLDLNLPQEGNYTLNNQPVYYYNASGFRLVLKIFTTYGVLADERKLMVEKLELAEIDTALGWSALKSCGETIQVLGSSNKNLHNKLALREKQHKSKAIKEKIKLILIPTGVGVVGVAVGILIGFFAIR